MIYEVGQIEVLFTLLDAKAIMSLCSASELSQEPDYKMKTVQKKNNKKNDDPTTVPLCRQSIKMPKIACYFKPSAIFLEGKMYM